MTARESNPRTRRRTFLVDRRLQLRFTGLMVVPAAAIGVLFLVLFWRVRAECGGTGILRFAHPGIVGAFLGVALGTLAVAGIVATHRFAGPLVYLGRVLRLVGAGERPRLRALRDGDELGAFSVVVTDMVGALEAREREEVAHLDVAVQALEEGETQIARVALRALADEKRKRLPAPSLPAAEVRKDG